MHRRSLFLGCENDPEAGGKALAVHEDRSKFASAWTLVAICDSINPYSNWSVQLSSGFSVHPRPNHGGSILMRSRGKKREIKRIGRFVSDNARFVSGCIGFPTAAFFLFFSSIFLQGRASFTSLVGVLLFRWGVAYLLSTVSLMLYPYPRSCDTKWTYVSTALINLCVGIALIALRIPFWIGLASYITVFYEDRFLQSVRPLPGMSSEWSESDTASLSHPWKHSLRHSFLAIALYIFGYVFGACLRKI